VLDFTAALLCYYPASLCILLLQIVYKSTSLFIVNLFIHAHSHELAASENAGFSPEAAVVTLASCVLASTSSDQPPASTSALLS